MKNKSESRLIAERRKKFADFKNGENAFPNDFKPTTNAAKLHQKWGAFDREILEKKAKTANIAGRIMRKRMMGKVGFLTVKDGGGEIQIFGSQKILGECYADFENWDLGDIIGVSGTIFKTKTGELSIRAQSAFLLVKSLRPPPEKFHGLEDQETRYRQRYLDLMTNAKTQNLFRTRSRIIQAVRQFFNGKNYLEVETPMMHPLPGGANAKPFITRHNVLGVDLFLRIAPELYLKRLIIGGFPRVFEINRSFRNEGLSTRHNPEFTMLEFYCAYANYQDLMVVIEKLLHRIIRKICAQKTDENRFLNFPQKFVRLDFFDAILRHNPKIKNDDLSAKNIQKTAKNLKIKIEKKWGRGKIALEIFEKTVEEKLIEPTFIIDYPTEVSPLARQKNDDPERVERFELFINGREIANGFSELNDPEEQARRFSAQAGIDAMRYDEDYIRALEYAMPPTAGAGVGIDRLVMILTNAKSIRDVLLFPQMRPK